jgi:glycosyltransferase involved in cell wall biosynthesis
MNELAQFNVSIILTVFNRSVYLPRSIDSVLNQTFLNWELIAIDDGSTDNSFEVLKYYEKKFPGIKIIRQENRGLAISRNRGIMLSSGKYITFLDSDDEYEKSHLLKRIMYLETYPNIDLLYGGVQITGNQYVRDKNNPSNFIHISKCIVGATFFGKKNVFFELGGFKNLDYSEDSDFLERAEKRFITKEINFPTYIYHRELNDSLTNSYVPSSV